MAITRRQFLTSSAASALALGASPWLRWLPGTNVSYAAGPNDAIVVFVQLFGGNDGINMVYPRAGAERTKYTGFRTTLPLQLPGTNGEAATRATDAGFGSSTVLSVGNNSNGSEYALHPAMDALHQQVYQAGKLAIINGVHYPFADHSHFRSMAIWYAADPLGAASLGWFGKYLNVAGFQSTQVPGVMVGGGLSPLFLPTNTSLFAFGNLFDLSFPAEGEVVEKQTTFRALYNQSAALSPASFPELVRLGQTGVASIDHIQDYYKGDPPANIGKVEALLLDGNGNYNGGDSLVYTSPLNSVVDPNGNELGLARDLRHVAATIRADVGARFFHVGVGGYDTHSNQEDGFYHSYLLQEVSASLAAFYGEMNQAVTLPGGYSGYQTGNLANKVIVVVFSEFGRTIRQNATNAVVAGTDHATSAPVLILGGAVVGGQYGTYPLLDDPGENDDDLKMTYDFRDVFGTILTRWLTVSLADVGPGPGKILLDTPQTDVLGRNYTTFTPIGFLAP